MSLTEKYQKNFATRSDVKASEKKTGENETGSSKKNLKTGSYTGNGNNDLSEKEVEKSDDKKTVGIVDPRSRLSQ